MSAMSDKDAARKEALLKVCDTWGIDLDARTSAAEDIEAYLNGEVSIKKWAAVTSGGESGEYVYVYADFATEFGAQSKAEENILDGIYSEVPLAVVNLDTGDTLYPCNVRVDWRTA